MEALFSKTEFPLIFQLSQILYSKNDDSTQQRVFILTFILGNVFVYELQMY